MVKYYISIIADGVCRWRDDTFKKGEVFSIPKGAIEVTREVWHQMMVSPPIGKQWSYDEKLKTASLIDIVLTEEETLSRLTNSVVYAIEAYILRMIKEMPYDYDNVDQLTSWVSHSEYGEEASKLLDWCISCQTTAFKVKAGLVKYESAEAAIESLTTFPFKQ